MIHQLCRCRQAGCTDTDTEERRRAFLADLSAATGQPITPAPYIVLVGTTATASVSVATWRTTL